MLNGENRLLGSLRRFYKQEDGATMVEYGLIVALISVSIIAGVQSIGSRIDSVFKILIDALATYVG